MYTKIKGKKGGRLLSATLGKAPTMGDQRLSEWSLWKPHDHCRPSLHLQSSSWLPEVGCRHFQLIGADSWWFRRTHEIVSGEFAPGKSENKNIGY